MENKKVYFLKTKTYNSENNKKVQMMQTIQDSINSYVTSKETEAKEWENRCIEAEEQISIKDNVILTLQEDLQKNDATRKSLQQQIKEKEEQIKERLPVEKYVEQIKILEHKIENQRTTHKEQMETTKRKHEEEIKVSKNAYVCLEMKMETMRKEGEQNKRNFIYKLTDFINNNQ